MIRSDRFLLGIVAGVAVLVVVAFALVLRKPALTYRSDAAADAVAHNYLLAIQNGDYARAYGYLSSSVAGYPASVERFVDDITGQGWRTSGSATFRVKPAVVTGARAVVNVQMTEFNQGGLFGSDTYTNEFNVRLAEESGTWRVIGTDGWFWNECWERPDSDWCRDRLATPSVKQAAP